MAEWESRLAALLLAEAKDEVEQMGVLSVSTYIALNNLGLDPEWIQDYLSKEQESQ